MPILENLSDFRKHVLNSVKTDKLPLRLFLSGGAGVGKSTVTNALYEALIRYLNSQPENDPDDISIREGKHTDADIEVLNQRILRINQEHPDYPISATHLFSTNMAVDQHNHDIFQKSSNEKIDVKAIDIVLGDLSDELEERIKKQIPNDPSKTMGLYSVCSILKEAKYDLTTNVSVVDGMTNGAECIIKKIDYRVEAEEVGQLSREYLD